VTPDRDASEGSAERPTVVHLITTLTQGGAERVLSQVVPRPDEAPDERHVVVSLADGGMFADELIAAGVEVRGLGMRPGRDVVRGTLRLAVLLREVRPTLVVSWMYHACLLDLLARPLAGRARRARMVWFLQGSLHSLETLSRSTRSVVRILAATSRRPNVIAINSRTGQRQHVAHGFRARRWVHLPNGCDTDRFRPDDCDRVRVRAELGVPEDTALVLFVGRHHPEKGTDVLLEALERLAMDHRPVVVLLGSGTEPLTADGTVRTLGLGVRTDVESLLRGADLLVLPSRSEGTPNAVIEAMASEVPCVVTDVGDSADLVGTTGIIVAPGSVEELAQGLHRMIAMGPDERRRRGIEARARIVERYSMAVARERYRSLWAEMPS
jgi:glycosyltransferase involved in cell wall biosynthesis